MATSQSNMSRAEMLARSQFLEQLDRDAMQMSVADTKEIATRMGYQNARVYFLAMPGPVNGNYMVLNGQPGFYIKIGDSEHMSDKLLARPGYRTNNPAYFGFNNDTAPPPNSMSVNGVPASYGNWLEHRYLPSYVNTWALSEWNWITPKAGGSIDALRNDLLVTMCLFREMKIKGTTGDGDAVYHTFIAHLTQLTTTYNCVAAYQYLGGAIGNKPLETDPAHYQSQQVFNGNWVNGVRAQYIH